MTVKQELYQWIITNKHALNDDAETHVTFRAGEAAADLATNINNVSKALGTLRDEGLVVNPAHGVWAWTGAVIHEAEKAPRSPRKARSKDNMTNVVNTLWDAVLEARQRLHKAEWAVEEASTALAAAKVSVDIIRTEEAALTSAYNLLKKDEEE